MTRVKGLISCDFHSVFDSTSDQHGQMLHPIDQEACAAEQQQRKAIRVEQLSMIAAPRNAGRRFHESEVIYGNMQPMNVCQGCFSRNKFCDFQSRGPRARVRKCIACADSHCACIMTTKEGAVRDPDGSLSICQTFKCYFRQYRHALYILKHQSRFRGTEHGQAKLREAQRNVRKFHPVSARALRKYVIVCPRKSNEVSTRDSTDISVKVKTHPSTTPESGANIDHPADITEGESHPADDNDPARTNCSALSENQAANVKNSIARPPPHLLLSDAPYN